MCFQWAVSQIESTPIVGILTLHTSSKLGYPENSTYFYASYAKWLEQSEMRWIPISVYDSSEIIADKLAKVNGVHLTGGNEVLGTKEIPSLYGKVVKQILDFAIKQNDSGTAYPVFGICMGFQSMMVVLSNYEIQLEKVHNENQSLSIKFTPAASNSFLNLYFNQKQTDALNLQSVFYFHHRDGFTMEQINKSNYVTQNIKVLASVKTPQNVDILAIFQHKTYPFVAVEFHPEKVQFEYFDNAMINKSEYSMQVNAGFSKLFRRLIGEVKAKLKNNEVLDYRISVKLEVKYGNADEAFVFESKTDDFPKAARNILVDETTPE